MPSPTGALWTVEDYEQCAREASSKVKHVKVRVNADDPKVPRGTMRIWVRGRFWRRLPEREQRRVHHAIAELNPINVALEMR